MNSKLRHTPKGWKVTRREEPNSADGFATVVTDSRGHSLAIMNFRGKNPLTKGNARLMAKSPELLEVAEALADATSLGDLTDAAALACLVLQELRS